MQILRTNNNKNKIPPSLTPVFSHTPLNPVPPPPPPPPTTLGFSPEKFAAHGRSPTPPQTTRMWAIAVALGRAQWMRGGGSCGGWRVGSCSAGLDADGQNLREYQR